MKVKLNIFAVLLLASAISLSSCVNQVNPPKVGTNDTASIIISIPDSNNVLAVDFHATIKPPWQKNYRIDWNFGDSAGVISKFDTTNLTHYFRGYGIYNVSLRVFDTLNNILLAKTSISIDLEDFTLDTNFLHSFNKVDISFFVASENLDFSSDKITPSNINLSYSGENPPYTPTYSWGKNSFTVSGYYNDNHAEYNQYGFQTAQISRGNGFSIGFSVSHSGYQIDSGRYSAGSSDRSIYQHDWVFANSVRSFTYHSLPRIFLSKDSMVFAYSGKELQSMITQVEDSSNFVSSTILPPPTRGSGYHMVNLLWDTLPTPILRVKLYK